MGRGAGNTPTENLLAVLDQRGSQYNSKPIYELVIRHFESMQKEYGWGSNLLYFLGAQNDVHPTYIQNLLSNSHYGTDEIVGAIDYLSKIEGTTSYNGVVLDKALSFSNEEASTAGSSSLSGEFDNKDVLIVANGPSCKAHSSAIEQYISQAKPTVISINIVDAISADYINYYAISHNSKFLSDASKYQSLEKTVILPKHRFTSEEMALLKGIKYLDYGVEVVPGRLEHSDNSATIPYDVTIGYVLAMLMASTPKSVSLVGFDGYDSHDVRQTEMLNILDLLSKSKNTYSLMSLTPTSYPLKKGSIYAPVI